MSEAGLLSLRDTLDAASVPTLYKQVRRREGIEVIDLSEVSAVDSAGVAFVRYLQAAQQRNGRRPQLRGVPAHFEQLCRAHRVNGKDERAANGETAA